MFLHYIHTFIMFKQAEFGKHTWIHRSKTEKKMLILKFHPGMKCCLHVFFSFFHPGMKFHCCLSSRDEISSRQKRVNSKRHFSIDRDDFILGQNSFRDDISRVNTLLICAKIISVQCLNIWIKEKHYSNSKVISNIQNIRFVINLCSFWWS